MPNLNSPGDEQLGMPAEDVLSATQLRELRQRIGAYSSFGTITDRELAEWASLEVGGPIELEHRMRTLSVIKTKGLRPLIDIQADSYPELAAPWLAINQHRNFIERCIRATGRIEIPNHPLGLPWAGTGVVIGRQLIMTNRHVVETFVKGIAPPWHFLEGVSPHIDFKRESNGGAALKVPITRATLIHQSWDVALLETAPLPNSIVPVPLSSTPPAQHAETIVAIVGYPGVDYSASAVELNEQLALLGGNSGTKRLQPGRTQGLTMLNWYGKQHEALTHDCTTTRGNSGSGVFDVERQQVVGIHFHGIFAKANYSVPVWRLAQDNRFAIAGVIFS